MAIRALHGPGPGSASNSRPRWAGSTTVCRRTVFGLCYPIQAGTVELVNERARALIVDIFNRSLTAVHDHNATEFLLD